MIIEEIDILDIKSILSKLRWDNCKIIIHGNSLVETITQSENWEEEAIT